ncbi:hypothetical protein [Herbidospora sp. NBRC 101105]|uniref:hypothetical protein n=1 Tax=Herbidospora sp. NBRC 101105 TaxID=3032195 RepID=UPI0024A0FC75|nr:hypothetical protein [Herbidospora sp. NBRC 101105]GLX99230.1 hypothetical protein Hesp01_71800 [Herbidospora sp. NBRC 101105]
MASGLAESMDRQALRLRERLLFWAAVLAGAPCVYLGAFAISLREYDEDRIAAFLGTVVTGGGVVLLLAGMWIRRRSRRSWIVPIVYLVMAAVHLVWLVLDPAGISQL